MDGRAPRDAVTQESVEGGERARTCTRTHARARTRARALIWCHVDKE